MRMLLATIGATTMLSAGMAQAQDAPSTPSGREALTLLVDGVKFQTVAGRGQVPAYADYLKAKLLSAGFDAADVTFVPMGETGYLTARYPGRDRRAKPTVVLAHMDVVEADPKDWTRDPFTPVVENGEVVIRNVMSMTLSVDHRVIDGALGAQLLEAIVNHLENPMGMLA